MVKSLRGDEGRRLKLRGLDGAGKTPQSMRGKSPSDAGIGGGRQKSGEVRSSRPRILYLADFFKALGFFRAIAALAGGAGRCGPRVAHASCERRKSGAGAALRVLAALTVMVSAQRRSFKSFTFGGRKAD